MYGARPIEDLTVTRFYTTSSINKVMNNIHEFDSALREAFINGSQEDGVVYIRKDTQHRIIPCSPNKILLSKTTTLKPSSRLLPKGFTLKSKTNLRKPVGIIDELIKISAQSNTSQPFLMEIEKVTTIVHCINETFKNEDDWDLKAFLSSLE